MVLGLGALRGAAKDDWGLDRSVVSLGVAGGGPGSDRPRPLPVPETKVPLVERAPERVGAREGVFFGDVGLGMWRMVEQGRRARAPRGSVGWRVCGGVGRAEGLTDEVRPRGPQQLAETQERGVEFGTVTPGDQDAVVGQGGGDAE